MATYSKTGSLLGNETLARFFGTGGNFISDPRVLYDNQSGRWFASLTVFYLNYTALAVSATSDPMGAWTVYQISTLNATLLADQPYLGVSTWMVGVSSNAFTRSSLVFFGGLYEVVNKTNLLAGTSAAYYAFAPSSALPSGRSVQSLTPTPVQRFAQLTSGVALLTEIDVTNAPPAVPAMSTFSVAIAAVSGVSAAPQKGTTDLLDTGDGRLISAVWQGGLLTTAFTDGCAGVTCMRLDQWWSSNATIRQDTEFSSPGNWILYPAASVDRAGNIGLVYGISSTSGFPSVLVGGQSWYHPGILDYLFTAVSGTAPVTVACNGATPPVCRYGDYFGAAPDPLSTQLWLAGEYVDPHAAWSTWIQAVPLPLAATAVATPATINLGQPTTLSVSASGGYGGYKYDWVALPPGCSGANMATLSCIPTSAGTFAISVVVYDAALYFVVGQTTVTVNPLLSITTPVPSRSSADEGQVVVYTTSASGGTAPLTYTWTGLPTTGCTGSATNTATCLFASGSAGTLSVQVSVTDAHGMAAVSGTLSFTVYPAPRVGVPTATPSGSIDLGIPINLTARASGGSGGYTYVWQGLPTGCPGPSAPKIVCTPTGAGVFAIAVQVNDSNGVGVSSAPLAYTIYPTLGVPTPAVSSPSVTAGSQLQFAVAPSGGTGSYSFSWQGLPTGCPDANLSILNCRANITGTYHVFVVISDTNGAKVTTPSVVVSVVKMPPAPTGIPTISWVITGVLAGLAAVLLVLLFLRLRKREPTPAAPLGATTPEAAVTGNGGPMRPGPPPA